MTLLAGRQEGADGMPHRTSPSAKAHVSGSIQEQAPQLAPRRKPRRLLATAATALSTLQSGPSPRPAAHKQARLSAPGCTSPAHPPHQLIQTRSRPALLLPSASRRASVPGKALAWPSRPAQAGGMHRRLTGSPAPTTFTGAYQLARAPTKPDAGAAARLGRGRHLRVAQRRAQALQAADRAPRGRREGAQLALRQVEGAPPLLALVHPRDCRQVPARASRGLTMLTLMGRGSTPTRNCRRWVRGPPHEARGLPGEPAACAERRPERRGGLQAVQPE